MGSLSEAIQLGRELLAAIRELTAELRRKRAELERSQAEDFERWRRLHGRERV